MSGVSELPHGEQEAGLDGTAGSGRVRGREGEGRRPAGLLFSAELTVDPPTSADK